MKRKVFLLDGGRTLSTRRTRDVCDASRRECVDTGREWTRRTTFPCCCFDPSVTFSTPLSDSFFLKWTHNPPPPSFQSKTMPRRSRPSGRSSPRRRSRSTRSRSSRSNRSRPNVQKNRSKKGSCNRRYRAPPNVLSCAYQNCDGELNTVCYRPTENEWRTYYQCKTCQRYQSCRDGLTIIRREEACPCC